MSNRGKSIDTEGSGCPRLVGGESGEKWGVTTNGHGVSLWTCDENVLKVVVVTTVQFGEYTESHWKAHFKQVNWMVCECYLKKAVLLRNSQNDMKDYYGMRRYVSQWLHKLLKILSERGNSTFEDSHQTFSFSK